ncbi:MAG: AAA family ATPase [Gemmatimonadales bacterium]|nr:AAA family ATPase [Gemmatimonadales bacterium]
MRLAAKVESDVARFLAACEADPAQAAQFDVPRFLEGLAVRGAPAWDEWHDAQREALFVRFRRALAAVARRAMEGWRWREAIAWSERLLATDPLADEAMRYAVEAHFCAGERDTALARGRAHVARCEAEGLLPSRALLDLLDDIARAPARVPTRPVTQEFATRHAPLAPTLAGREEAWQALQRRWRRARHGEGGMVLLTGAPAVGKTRVATEFVTWATASGATVAQATAGDPYTAVPYGAVTELLRRLLDAPGLVATAPEALAEVARILPALRGRFPALPPVPPMPEVGDRLRLHDAVVQLLASLAAERPVLLLLDEAEWADTDSLALLGWLRDALAAQPVLLLLAGTPALAEPDGAFARLAAAVGGEASPARVELPPLAEAVCVGIVRELAGLGPEGEGRAFAEAIARLSAGRPGWLLELLKLLLAAGIVQAHGADGRWRLAAAPVDVPLEPLPPLATSLVLAPLEAIGAEARAVADALSGGVSALTPARLAAGLGGAPLAHSALAERLVAAGLAEARGDGYALRPLVAAALRGAMSPARRAACAALHDAAPAAGEQPLLLGAGALDLPRA